ncbi:hypothetical protein BGW36DRAFT_369159 [Talaromyces proteolyticus]|uniref:Uncharacterized protein n=1 Tax=Talaromyces proteolyticus TaxID=1131652 RepID=A0AAD4Q4P4_9EURO|nr:uncharacterized protein BGW36DRAFT_369159 [Talaromyces proteolyticus]KAH8703324.1 hypothetical protein BGW36DRAFT_369159 [Talaromyces proteolyticus]
MPICPLLFFPVTSCDRMLIHYIAYLLLLLLSALLSPLPTHLPIPPFPPLAFYILYPSNLPILLLFPVALAS